MMAKVDQFLNDLVYYDKENIHPDVVKVGCFTFSLCTSILYFDFNGYYTSHMFSGGTTLH